MKTNLFNAKHHGRVGPGGWKCSCCSPCPSARPLFARMHKKWIYKMLDRLEKDD